MYEQSWALLGRLTGFLFQILIIIAFVSYFVNKKKGKGDYSYKCSKCNEFVPINKNTDGTVTCKKCGTLLTE